MKKQKKKLKATMWAVKPPHGSYHATYVTFCNGSIWKTRKDAINSVSNGVSDWRECYKMGYRTVKVNVEEL